MTEKRNGIVQGYYDMSQINLWYEHFIFNGKKEGEYKSYYRDGQLEEICNYKNNNMEGEYKYYYKNGQIWGTRNYKNGKLEGEFIIYHENGQICEILNYKNGNLVIRLKYKSYCIIL